MDSPDLSLTWIISVSAPALLLTYFWFSRRNPKYPPCPLRPWPIVGNLLQLNPDPRGQFADFRKQCGDIYSLYLGPKHVVILSSLNAVKEAFIRQGDDFSDRATIYLDIASNGVRKGMLASNGAPWKEQRLFVAAAMRSFGQGKNIFVEKIQEEVSYFMELLDGLKGQNTDIYTSLDVSVSNIMCSIVAGHRYEYDDKEFLRLQELMKFNLTKLQGTAILNYFPWLRFLPGDLFCCKVLEKNYQEFYDIFAHVHMKENENVVGEPGNFIAAYLQEMKKKEFKGEPTCMDKENLLRSILDMFLAGTETTTNTFLWFFLYMIHYPNIQEKIFQEIKSVVGLDRTPGMQDRSKLIYLTATIMEVQRLASLVPLGLPRVVSHDVILSGYQIPRGTEIMVNNDSILHDPTLWGDDSATFRPDRFINNERTLMVPEAWIPFSLGRRACNGESLASMELYLFISNILQRFSVAPADPNKIPPVKGYFGLSHNPVRFNITFPSRRK